MLKYIEGGVTAPKGFTAGGLHAGIRKNKAKRDVALIKCAHRCPSAAVYTQNLVKGSPIIVTQNNLSDSMAQAVICNSGNANTCNADGEEKAVLMCEIAAKALKIDAKDIIVASTGVIGQVLPIEPFYAIENQMADSLKANGSADAAEAILTTDTYKKEIAAVFSVNGVELTIGGIAKGSGMIHPNMATMLGFLTTDAPVSPSALKKALLSAVEVSFNMISVDGDTSTNDMVSIMASGDAGGDEITEDSEGFTAFTNALTEVCTNLAKQIARDGEGASRLLECKVTGASDDKAARIISKAVICSSLTKAAMFGADANWGRVLCAVGYAGVPVDISKVGVSFESSGGRIEVCKNGAGIDFSEELAKKVLTNSEILIDVSLSDGDGTASAYGCDLTYDYVKINGDYRT